MYDKARVEQLLKSERTKESIEELIRLNRGLVHKQLIRFYLVNDHDAVSYGYEALYNAILTFDISKNSTFSTYATVCIYNRLGSYIRSLNTQIMTNVITSTNEDGTSLLDNVEGSLTADGDVLQRTGLVLIVEAIDYCLDGLTNPTHKQIVLIWIKSDFKMVHTSIAQLMNCSQTYVSQVIKRFKGKLKEKLEELHNA